MTIKHTRGTWFSLLLAIIYEKFEAFFARAIVGKIFPYS